MAAIADCITALELESAKFTAALIAPNTNRGYRFDQAAFGTWARQMGLESLPAAPHTLGLWITSMLCRKLKVSTCERRLAAIAHQHAELNLASPATPEIRALLRGARRLRTEQVARALPLSVDELRAIAKMLLGDDTPIAIRNWTIMLVGFAGALRNSMTAALMLSDVEFTDRGSILNIRKSKTDQIGKGRLIGLPWGKHPETCPTKNLEQWIRRRGSFPGPLFTRLDGHAPRERGLLPERIGQIVQDSIRRIGLDESRGRFSGHSLRSGFVTEAGELGAGDFLIAAQTGHTDMRTLKDYFRRRDVFARNALISMDL